mmetsp:Transcript_41183/g.106623  ORF Transcript_41183/g.106623 Transcript_41183/m.106623 type:complete len:210 (-) Transcript_41183:71-700(-)
MQRSACCACSRTQQPAPRHRALAACRLALHLPLPRAAFPPRPPPLPPPRPFPFPFAALPSASVNCSPAVCFRRSFTSSGSASSMSSSSRATSSCPISGSPSTTSASEGAFLFLPALALEKLCSSTIIVVLAFMPDLLKARVKADFTCVGTSFMGSSAHGALDLNLVMSRTLSNSSRLMQYSCMASMTPGMASWPCCRRGCVRMYRRLGR